SRSASRQPGEGFRGRALGDAARESPRDPRRHPRDARSVGCDGRETQGRGRELREDLQLSGGCARAAGQMSYVEQSLGEGEVVRHVAHKHWVIFVVPILQLLIALVLIGLGYKIDDVWTRLGWLMRVLGFLVFAFGTLHLLRAWL